MFYKKIVFLTLLTFCSLVSAQTRNNEWQIGVGTSITRFSDEYAATVNDKHQIQIPRLNITFPLSDNLSFDSAIAVETFDFASIQNDAFYLSTDFSVRYHFDVRKWFYPYVFGGASLVNTDFSLYPSLNVGAGATFWFNTLIGFNMQTYYKNALESADVSRSHFQFTGGLVFAIDLFDLLIFGTTGKVCY